MDESEFLNLSREHGYKALRWADGHYLLASVAPEHAHLFSAGCACRIFQPDARSAPDRFRYEVQWVPTAPTPRDALADQHENVIDIIDEPEELSAA